MLVRLIDADEHIDLDLHKWYLDDGVLAGPVSSVLRAFHIISSEGPDLGLSLNLGKCELYSHNAANFSHWVKPGLHRVRFPADIVIRSTLPHFLLLGSPIGDANFCSSYINKLRASNQKLLSSLPLLHDPQVALHLLRSCASFCKFVHIARTTPSDLVSEPLQRCDEDFRTCFAQLAAQGEMYNL